MRPTRVPRVKVCCISSPAEAHLAIAAGASALGLVGWMPSGPGVIGDALIAEIVRTVPPPVATFLLTSERTAAEIIAHHRRVLTTTLQLVDEVPFADLLRIRKGLPGITLVQVIHVTGPASLEAACAVAPLVDALLLDSGRPDLPVKELGGTGRTHNWEISRQIREAVAIPLFLAGGLHAGNVGDALAAVEPFGLDLCSGVRTHHELDPAKLEAFFAAVRAACSPG
jgi:phosphoribosylanthranilate isomerase